MRLKLEDWSKRVSSMTGVVSAMRDMMARCLRSGLDDVCYPDYRQHSKVKVWNPMNLIP